MLIGAANLWVKIWPNLTRPNPGSQQTRTNLKDDFRSGGPRKAAWINQVTIAVYG